MLIAIAGVLGSLFGLIALIGSWGKRWFRRVVECHPSKVKLNPQLDPLNDDEQQQLKAYVGDTEDELDPLNDDEQQQLKAYVGDTEDEHEFVTRVSEWLRARAARH